MTRSIADAVVIKREDLFFVCESSGDVPCTEAHGFGLYYHDCRYLNGYVLRLFDRPLEVLGVDASAGFRASFQLTNPDLHDIGDDDRLIAKETIALKWERTIDVPSTMLVDVIEVNNFGTEWMELKVSMELRAQFEALFGVRGTQPKQRGSLHAPVWRSDRLLLAYDGADGLHRRLVVRFDPAPAETHETAALFRLPVPSRGTVRLHVYLDVQEEPDERPQDARASQPMQRSIDAWNERATRVRTDSRVFDRVLDRSLRDLHVLTSTSAANVTLPRVCRGT